MTHGLNYTKHHTTGKTNNKTMVYLITVVEGVTEVLKPCLRAVNIKLKEFFISKKKGITEECPAETKTCI